MYQRIARGVLALVIAFLFSQFSALAAPDGKALFSSNCASCHNPLKDATGPALQGVDKRVPSKEWLYKWIHNPPGMIDSDPYAKELFAKWGPTKMTAFPSLSNEEIDAILTFVNSVPKPEDGPKNPEGKTESGEDNTWLYGIITFVLLVLAVILWKANTGLRQAANDKDGVANVKDIPLYRNKVVIAIVAIVIFIGAGYRIVNGAIGLGRQQNYQPKQPIFYSHTVHAGVNQVNCLYCHAGAEKSRQAMIPSTNVCMNCHKQISEYTGADKHPLVDAEGNTVNGTAQIDSLYKYAGWDKEKRAYKRDTAGNILATPIKWVKIHNLPDHVYFNHSQHVKVGQVQCQRCHGAIQEMDEVYQFAPLSMGWCVNCHRQTEVQFSNKYYTIYEKYHKELESGERSGVTVEDIGGLECQRCHY